MIAEALYEQLLGLRMQLRAMEAQVTFLIEEVKAASKPEPEPEAEIPRDKPPTFGSRREIENHGERTG